MTKHDLLKAVRLTHLYYGVFISPALLFFAFTGFIQTYHLHTKNGSNNPSLLIQRLAFLHKEGSIDINQRGPGFRVEKAPGQGQGQPQGEVQGQPQGQGQRPGRPQDGGSDQGQPQARGQGRNGDRGPGQGPGQGAQLTLEKPHWPEKIFFGVVAVGLFTATLTGLYMSWMYSRRKIFIILIFTAGVVLPVVFLAF